MMNTWKYVSYGVAAVLLIGAAVNSLLVAFDHNEHMYVEAGVLISRGEALYADFAYLQMPYLPLLYSIVFDVVAAPSYLLVAKSMSVFFYLLAGLLLYAVTWRVSYNATTAGSVAIIFLLNSTIMRVAEESSNYILPIAFSFLAFGFFTSVHHDARYRAVRLFLAGLCLAVAIGTKLYYLPSVLAFVYVALRLPQALSLQRRVREILLPFVGGLSLGLLPIGYYLLRDPAQFFFNNLGYHQLNTTWRALTGMQEGMTLDTKFEFLVKSVFTQDTLLVFVGLVLAAVAFVLARRSQSSTLTHFSRTEPMLALALLVTSLPAIFVPTPVHVQHYAMPISFAFLSLATLTPTLNRSRVLAASPLMTVLLVLSILYTAPTLLENLGRVSAGTATANIGRAIAAEVDWNGTGSDKLATITPIFALGAGLSIYPELASGPFLYRIGDLLSHDAQTQFRATGPSTVTELLTQDPPAAILVHSDESEYAESNYAELERPFVEFATQWGYRRVEQEIDGIVLFVAPAEMAQGDVALD